MLVGWSEQAKALKILIHDLQFRARGNCGIQWTTLNPMLLLYFKGGQGGRPTQVRQETGVKVSCAVWVSFTVKVPYWRNFNILAPFKTPALEHKFLLVLDFKPSCIYPFVSQFVAPESRHFNVAVGCSVGRPTLLEPLGHPGTTTGTTMSYRG